MIESLRIKAIYDDFLDKVSLNEEQIAIINKLIDKDNITKISIDLQRSERTIGYEINKIKKLYEKYRNFEVMKANLLEK